MGGGISAVGGRNITQFTDHGLEFTDRRKERSYTASSWFERSLRSSSVDLRAVSSDLRTAITHMGAWDKFCDLFRSVKKAEILDKTATLILIAKGRAGGISDEKLFEVLSPLGGLSVDEQAGEALRFFFGQHNSSHPDGLRSLIDSNFLREAVARDSSELAAGNGGCAGMLRFSDSVPVLGELSVPYAFAQASRAPEVLRQQTIGDLDFACLRRAKMDGVDLEGGLMDHADLQDADFSGARLRKVSMWKAELNRADMRKANAQGANMQDADLREADMRGADMRLAKMEGARMEGAKMEGAIVDTSLLFHPSVDLHGAIVSAPYIQGESWMEEKFREQVDDRIGIRRYEVETDFFNHRDNETSVLKNISALDDSCFAQKQALMRVVVEALDAVGRAKQSVIDLAPPLGDVLFQDPLYLAGHGDFGEWLCDQLLGRGSVLLDEKLHDTALTAVGDHAARLLQKQGFQAIAGRSVAIYQVLYAMRERAASASSPEGREKWATQARALHEQYCTVLSHRLPSLMGTGGVYKSELDVFSDDDIFPLVAADGLSCVMMTDQGYRRLGLGDRSRSEDGSPGWDDLRCVRAQSDGTFPASETGAGEGGTRGTASTTSVLNEFPLLRSARERDKVGELHRQLLALSGLNGKLLTRFMDALQQRDTRELAKKMIVPSDQDALTEIFSKKYADHFEKGVYLAEAHVAELRAQRPDDSEQAFAFRLLCLAALYTNYSSSHVFGTELDSPYALRHYAEALLRKASELNPHKSFGDWINILRGSKGEFPCTAMLYKQQSLYLDDAIRRSEAGSKTSPLRQIRDEMMPLAWR